MFKFSIIILIAVFLSSCQTTSTSYKSKNNPYKVDLEDCLDKFFAPQVPLGKIEKYENWVMDSRSSLEAKKHCNTEIMAFLVNANYEMDKRFLSDIMWVRAMTLIKGSFKPNQREGKKHLFQPHGDPIGEWWAIPVKVVK